MARDAGLCRRGWMLALAFLVASGTALLADYESAERAFLRGDYEAALLEWRESASQGDVRSQFRLGTFYENGFEVNRDYVVVAQDHVEAMKWYRLAADQGHAKALFAIGVLHDKGRGVPQDEQEAMRWYRLAREQGCDEQKLTVVYVRWQPGPWALTLKEPPEDWKPYALTTGELELLGSAGLTGTLSMRGYSIKGDGVRSRAVIVMARQVEAEVLLPQPDAGRILHVQRETGWLTLPSGAPTLPRSLRVSSDPQRTQDTLVMIDHANGARSGGANFTWP